jgi:hypothetical protein
MSLNSLFDPNHAILAAILKSIPECFKAEDFRHLSYPHPAQKKVATMTVQEAIVISFMIYYTMISYYNI